LISGNALSGPSSGPSNDPSEFLVRRPFVTAGAGGLTGFSVFDQAHAMINTPQSPVPLAASGGQVNFYRLGSQARLAVAMDQALVSQEGSVINLPSSFSWDFVNQRLIPFLGTLTISSGTYVSGTGLGTLTMSAPVTAVIAYDLAFSDPSHFARFFRKQTGTTPHEFREGRGG